MTTPHQFGGQWTDDKLVILGKYLKAYRTIFSKNQYARRYTTLFIDAFAGTGYRAAPQDPQTPRLPLRLEDVPVYDPEVTQLLSFSTRMGWR